MRGGVRALKAICSATTKAPPEPLRGAGDATARNVSRRKEIVMSSVLPGGPKGGPGGGGGLEGELEERDGELDVEGAEDDAE
jgi:hypothetical protein